MGWRRGQNPNTAPRSGDTILMVFDESLGDDFGKSFDRENRKKKENASPKTGHTELVVVQ